MTAEEVVLAAGGLTEPDLKRQRLDTEAVATYDSGEIDDASIGGGAMAPIEPPPPMEFNPENDESVAYAEDTSYSAAVAGAADGWGGAETEGHGYDQFQVHSDVGEDVPQGDGAAQYGEEGDDDEEDEEDEDDDDDDDEAEEDEGGEDGDRGGEGEVEVKPDSVIWFNLSGVQRQAAQELQYTREAWDNCTRTEVTDQEYWHQLTDEQRAAAEVRWLADRLDPSRTCAPQPRTKSRGRGHARTWRPTAATNRSMWIIWLGPSANCCSCGVFTIAGAWLPERDMAQVEGAEIRR